VGAAASLLTLLPLTILGIWKPRLAAYLLGASFVIALAYPMLGPQSAGDVLGYLLFASVPALPIALVAGLLLYASFPQVRSHIQRLPDRSMKGDVKRKFSPWTG